MSDETDPPAARRGLSPAAWGAISAVVVALIGAIATVAPILMKDRPVPVQEANASAAAPSPSQVAAPAPAKPVMASDLAGNWIGVAQAPGGEPFSIGVDITPGCTLGHVCGRIVVTHVPCTGRLTLVSAGPGGFNFNVDDFQAPSDMDVCKPGDGEVLDVGPNDTLLYNATYSGAKGVLRRRP